MIVEEILAIVRHVEIKTIQIPNGTNADAFIQSVPTANYEQRVE